MNIMHSIESLWHDEEIKEILERHLVTRRVHDLTKQTWNSDKTGYLFTFVNGLVTKHATPTF